MKTEKSIVAVNGYIAIVMLLVTAALIAYGFVTYNIALGIALIPVFILTLKGLEARAWRLVLPSRAPAPQPLA